MRIAPGPRRALLALHLASSVGWVGAVAAYLTLAIAVAGTADAVTARAGWIGMELVGWYALLPLALVSLASGTLLALVSRWGLFRHYWVVISFAGTLLLTVVLVLHLPDVTALADVARSAPQRQLAGLGSDVPHAAAGGVLLVGILVLNVFKPRGLTRYGWRRERGAQ